MLHVIVTGPESSGKSTLARDLAAALGAVAVPEYPRGYLLAAGRRAVLSDFDHFARVDGQLREAAARQGRGVVRDTACEVLRVWAEDKFDSVPPAVDEAWRRQRPSAYVLCAPDLPWAFDPLREDPHRRRELHRRYRQLLAQTGVPVIDVGGSGEQRLRTALEPLRKLAGR